MQNRSGMSIMAVVVAAGLLGALAVGMSKLMSGSMSAQKSVDLSLDLTVIKGSLAQVFQSQVCGSAFRNATGAPLLIPPTPLPVNGTNAITVSKIMAGTAMVLDTTNPSHGWASLRLKFVNLVPAGTQLVGAIAMTAYLAELELAGTKGASASVGGQIPSQKFWVTILVNPSASNQIQGCANAASVASCPAGQAATGRILASGAPECKKTVIVCEIGGPVGAKRFMQGDILPQRPGHVCGPSVCRPPSNYVVRFSSVHCGGTSPDADYVGTINEFKICGGSIAHEIINPGVVYPYAGGSMTGPGFMFFAGPGAEGYCLHPPNHVGSVRVLYLLKGP